MKIEGDPLLNVDATPTSDYAIRILKAYRKNCDLYWSMSSGELNENELVKKLNDLQDERAKILDKAIKILERNED